MIIPKFVRTKPAFKSRLPNYNLFQYLILLAALGTVILIIYFTSFEFSWQRIRLPVIYNPASAGYLEVSKEDFSVDPGYLQGSIHGCDRIVAIADIPVTQYLNSGGRVLPDKLILLDILADNYSPALTKPPGSVRIQTTG